MTFRCPSFSAAATSAFMPPPAAADVAVDQFTLLLELVDPPVLLELLQPAMSAMLPTAAPATAIAFFARKITLPAVRVPRVRRAGLVILARQVPIMPGAGERDITSR